jgi:hypothetical protein
MRNLELELTDLGRQTFPRLVGRKAFEVPFKTYAVIVKNEGKFIRVKVEKGLGYWSPPYVYAVSLWKHKYPDAREPFI